MWLIVTGLFWDRTPTAGSQGRFSSSDRASALGAPVFADVSNIRSISKGNFQDTKRNRNESRILDHKRFWCIHLTGNIDRFLLFVHLHTSYLAFESLQHIQVSSKHGEA